MLNILRSDIRRAFLGPIYMICVMVFTGAVFIQDMDTILEIFRTEQKLQYGYFVDFILSAMKSETLCFLLPVICSLPYASTFALDMQTGFIKSYLPRTARRNYIWSKVLSCALSGGLVLASSLLLSCAVAATLFGRYEVSGTLAKISTWGAFSEGLVRFFFSGAFWALVGMTASALFKSRYMAYASPFILYYILIILYERYFDFLHLIYPKEWIYLQHNWPMGTFGVVIFLLELSVIVSCVFAYTARRRIGNV